MAKEVFRLGGLRENIRGAPHGAPLSSLCDPATVKPQAEWAGDDSYPASNSKPKTVRVHVVTKTVVSGNYGVSGKYRLFHERNVVKQVGTVLPNHAGKTLTFVAQERLGGRWRAVARKGFRIRLNGSVTAYFSGPRGSYRVRNIFTGDADHLGDAAPWRYVRITA